MDNELYVSNDELTHWGVRGMRWGVRRYQNKDGSLTPRGQKRYAAEMAKLKEEEKVLKNRKATKAKLDRLEAKRKANEDLKKEIDGDKSKTKKDGDDDASKKAAPAKKSMKDMSDAELQAAVNRARNEQAYAQLYGEQKVEKTSFMKKFVDDAVKPAAVNAGRDFLQKAIAKAGENLLKDKVDPNSIEALTKMRDKLKLTNEIERIKKGLSGKADDEINWVNMKNKRAYDDETERRRKEADEAARQANEERSRQEYEKTADTTYSRSYSKKSTTASSGKQTVSGLLTSGGNTPVLALPPATASSGKQTVSGLLTSGGNTPVLALPPATVSSGKTAADKFILEDRNGNAIISWTGDDD